MGALSDIFTTTWLLPVWPMLLGLGLGVLLLWGINTLVSRRGQMPSSTFFAIASGIVGLPLLLVAVVYFTVSDQRPLAVVLSAASAILIPAAIYGLLRLVFPKIAAIAYAACKEGLSQPLFWVTAALGVLALLLFPYVPYNTFGEDVKMLKDSGLVLIRVLSIILALWTASVSVSDEIEGKTALTVMSKPVSRRDFILGKFLGICGAVGMMFLILGPLFLATVSYKVVYDAGESAVAEPHWTECLAQMRQVAPGLALAFLEACVLTSISVAISTRLPMLPNLLICSSIYVVGHLIPLLVNSNLGNNEIVRFVARFFAAVLPMLDHYNIEAAISTGQQVPWIYLGATFLYSVVFCTFALLGALLLFEDRDLA